MLDRALKISAFDEAVKNAGEVLRARRARYDTVERQLVKTKVRIAELEDELVAMRIATDEATRSYNRLIAMRGGSNV